MKSFITKVVSFTDNGLPIVRLPSGKIVPGDRDLEDLDPELDEVFIYSDGWERAPQEIWQAVIHVGIVEEIQDSSVVIRYNEALFHRTVPEGLEVSPGEAVLFDEGTELLGIRKLKNESSLLPDAKESIDRFRTQLDPQKYTWESFAGSHQTLEQAQRIISVHADMNARTDLEALGVEPLRGLLFEGPPGTGKTFLAQIMAAQSNAAFYLVTTASLGGRLVGESEERLEAIYEDAAKRPLSIVFIDEIEVITKDRSADHDHGSRLVNVFLTNMDGVRAPSNVITIGTTNRVSDIDKALRRPGRFDREITFRAPNHSDRVEILQARSRRTSGSLDYHQIAGKTEGWTAADLGAIWQHAGELTVTSGRKSIYNDHFVMGFELANMARLNRLNGGR